VSDQAICREIFRKPDPQFADITVIGVACPDVDTAIAESVRIGREQGRSPYNRSYRAKGKIVTRYTIYRDETETNVYVGTSA
jgi:hypothetical protein